MTKAAKKHISVLCLLIFMLPLVGEQIHSYQHAADSQCNESQTTHIHKAEHHCFLCDSIIGTSTVPTDPHYIETNYSILKPFFSQFSSYTKQDHSCGYFLRGPPFIS